MFVTPLGTPVGVALGMGATSLALPRDLDLRPLTSSLLTPKYAHYRIFSVLQLFKQKIGDMGPIIVTLKVS